MRIDFTLNGQACAYEEGEGNATLLSYLRLAKRLVGTKNGCNEGHCGACTVIVDGKAVLACKTPVETLKGKEVWTIESLSNPDEIHCLVYAFAEAGAVQCGFCSPGFIMAAKALLDRDPNPPEEAIKKAFARNVCRCTGYVKILEAVALASRLMGEGKTWISRTALDKAEPARIGESIRRIDAIAKASGQMRFADDLVAEGMLHAKVLRSARPHAKILSIDAAEATDLPGVVKILLAKDIPGDNCYGPIRKDQPVLASDRVRYMGDALAAVFAETEAAGEAALKKIQVAYEDLPVLVGFDEALEPTAVRLHEGRDNTIAVMESGRGDVEKGFSSAALRIEGDYQTQYIEHGYLEPESCLALVDQEGVLTVYVASQGPPMDIAEIAPVVALPQEKIRIVGMPMGGGFGGKEDISVQIIAALGALATGRPVKYTFTRRESITVSGKRHATTMHYAVGVDAQGKITALQARIHALGGAYASVEEAVILRSASFAGGPYTIPAADVVAQAVYQTHAPACAMRGFGNPVATFGAETTMNKIAETLGIDPIELRLRNALEVGKPTLTGDRPTTSVGIKECLLAVQRALKDYVPPELGQEWASGIGIACSYKNVGFGIGMEDSGGATGEFRDDGRLLLRIGAVDMGQGSNSAMAQILSARLGWPVSRILVHAADTKLDPLAGMTTASRQTFITGNAVLAMADKLEEEMRSFASELLGLPSAALCLADSAFRRSDTGEALLSLEDLVDAARTKKHRLYAQARYVAPATKFNLKEPPQGYKTALEGKLHAAYCFAAQATALSVHRPTGTIKVHDVFIACDAGRVINRAGVEGQMHGGVMMGLGYAISEEYRENQGRPETDSFGKLGIPRIGQLPSIHCTIIENPHTDGPFGAKGMGELPLSMGAPSVAHAVRRAVGAWIHSLPLRPEKILAAMKEGRN
jgi:CO/xanthine dehydrogenase Mo-binding subunit/aerobic-type carbon monoxide dehydrogenase small subunit (CoxS/CutS family)